MSSPPVSSLDFMVFLSRPCHTFQTCMLCPVPLDEMLVPTMEDPLTEANAPTNSSNIFFFGKKDRQKFQRVCLLLHVALFACLVIVQ